jgi:hypothetical protein
LSTAAWPEFDLRAFVALLKEDGTYRMPPRKRWFEGRDASGTFGETKRQAGLPRMLKAGVILSDYPTLMVQILKDNIRPEGLAVCSAVD